LASTQLFDPSRGGDPLPATGISPEFLPRVHGSADDDTEALEEEGKHADALLTDTEDNPSDEGEDEDEVISSVLQSLGASSVESVAKPVQPSTELPGWVVPLTSGFLLGVLSLLFLQKLTKLYRARRAKNLTTTAIVDDVGVLKLLLRDKDVEVQRITQLFELYLHTQHVRRS
jgi:hypothetical protein